MTEGAELGGLFVSALTSATVLPGASEVVLVAVLAGGATSDAAAIAVATAGNTLGSIGNWALGRFFAGFRDRRWFPVPKDKFDRYVAAHRRWGVGVLLLSWAPIIGDPLTIISGVLRTPLWLFVPLVAAAKLARYLAVAGVVNLL